MVHILSEGYKSDFHSELTAICAGPESNRLREFAYKIADGNRALGDDFVQDTFVRALQYKEKFEMGTNMLAWLLTILRNLAINHFRAKKNASNLQFCEEMDSPRQQNPFERADAIIEREQIKAEVQRAIGWAPNRTHVQTTRMFYDDVPTLEIARIQGVTPATVATRCFRARQHIEAELGDYPYEELDFEPGAKPPSNAGRKRKAAPEPLELE